MTPEELIKRIQARQSAPARTGRYVAPADAVNETLRVNGLAPEQVAKKVAVVEGQKKAGEAQAKLQKARRDLYRARRQAEDKAAGRILSLPMTDLQVDLAMAQEALAANQPQLRLGYSEAERQQRRRMGLLYTQEDVELAKKLAEAHNASFFGSMVAPPISPEMAERNPGYVHQVIRGDAMVLPNAFLSGLSFGTPSATAAAVSGARLGWQAAGNMATRAWNATTLGAKAAAPVLTNPRWATVTGAVTIPSVAEAAVEAGDGGGSLGSYVPAILTTAGLVAGGYGGIKGYKTLKRSGWNLKALAPTKEGAAIRAASKAKSTALIPYIGEYLSPGLFGSFWETPKASAKAVGLPISKRQIWKARGNNFIRATAYGMGAGTLLDLGMSGASGQPFQWKAGRLPIALPEYVLKGGYNALSEWYYPNAGLALQTDSVTVLSAQPSNSTVQSDTIVPIPRSTEGPATGSTQAELDSINNAWFNGQPIQ